MNKKLQIRNSTAEFLTFASQNEGNSIEVRFEDNTLWLTQQLIAELFQTSVPLRPWSFCIVCSFQLRG